MTSKKWHPQNNVIEHHILAAFTPKIITKHIFYGDIQNLLTFFFENVDSHYSLSYFTPSRYVLCTVQ